MTAQRQDVVPLQGGEAVAHDPTERHPVIHLETQRSYWRRRGIALHIWLFIAVIIFVVGTFTAEIVLSTYMGAWQTQADAARLAAVRQIIGTNVAQWHAPMWQRRVAATLAQQGVEMQLIQLSGRSAGRLVYTTAGARTFLDIHSSVSVPAPAPIDQPYTKYDSSSTIATTFAKLVISAPISSAGQQLQPVGIAFLWFIQPAPDSPSNLLWVIVALGTIFVLLAAVVWLMRRWIVRPLAAMNRAVEGIAGGDMDVHLPASAVREIVEVSAALEGMTGALHDALVRQAALEEERKMFVGAIAHDLRTPLFMLRGYLKGLESGVAATPEKMAHYLSACRAKAEVLERLISDLFTYTRLEHLEQQPERTSLDLVALLSEAVDGVQPLAVEKGIALTLDGPAEHCPLIGDGHMLARVVTNLLDNALRYTPVGGQILISWRKDGPGGVIFTVQDSGPGIAAHDLPHLFDPLYRGEASRNRQTGGAGLGLTIARRIVEAHGGTLTAANRPLGGAVFSATLPVG